MGGLLTLVSQCSLFQCKSGEVGQVELNLIGALIKSHGHSTDEGLYTGG